MIFRRDDLPQDTHPFGRDLLTYRGGEGRCFYCHAFVSTPHAVEWHGDAVLWFHPVCVVDFVLRLMRDVHAIQCIEGREVHDRK